MSPLAEEGTTIPTHEMGFAHQPANRVIVIGQGLP
jgi:ABC-type polar amino acid transport system ATPase subunit